MTSRSQQECGEEDIERGNRLFAALDERPRRFSQTGNVTLVSHNTFTNVITRDTSLRFTQRDIPNLYGTDANAVTSGSTVIQYEYQPI